MRDGNKPRVGNSQEAGIVYFRHFHTTVEAYSGGKIFNTGKIKRRFRGVILTRSNCK